MSNTVLRVEHLSKQYRIGARIDPHATLRDQLAGALTGALAAPFHRNGRTSPTDDTIWALEDVSFEVKRGEVVGIIGRNGAGKSTLLKILSRITEPTEGRVRLRGRVGSLLEVGTGFHPELTGRENVYLNGAILGMKRAEIERKFDEIVAFAEIDRFIDTPVKRYSSGMYVRLAFAVAAHLDPEILVVDEVLAVGDARFQQKCISRLRDVSQDSKRTVLFVSHDMSAVSRLCTRGLLLQEGRIVYAGETRDTVARYLRVGSESAATSFRVPSAGKVAEVVEARFLDWQGLDVEYLQTGLGYQVEFVVKSTIAIPCVGVEFGLTDQYGVRMLFSNSYYVTGLAVGIGPGETRFRCRIPELPLLAGSYSLDVALFDESANHHRLQNRSGIGVVETHENDVFETGRTVSREWGGVYFRHEWMKIEQPQLAGE